MYAICLQLQPTNMLPKMSDILSQKISRHSLFNILTK
jgi:hypothetical protein